MVLARIGAYYTPFPLLILGCASALGAVFIFAQMWGYTAPTPGRRRLDIALRIVGWWSVLLTVAVLAAYVRFQFDPAYLRGTATLGTYEQFVPIDVVATVLVIATLPLVFVLTPLNLPLAQIRRFQRRATTLRQGRRTSGPAVPPPDTVSTYPIRRATIADATALAQLRWDFSPEEIAASGATFAAFREDFTRFLKDALAGGAWTIWVAEDPGGAIIGNIYIQRVAKVPRPGGFGHAWGYVTNVYLAPEHRNHGIGARLLAAVVTWARAERLEHLALWPSEEGIAFYRRAGFTGSDLLELNLEQ